MGYIYKYDICIIYIDRRIMAFILGNVYFFIMVILCAIVLPLQEAEAQAISCLGPFTEEARRNLCQSDHFVMFGTDCCCVSSI